MTMSVTFFKQIDFRLEDLSVLNDVQPVYKSLYNHYNLKMDSRIHVPHSLLVDSLFEKVGTIDADVIFYVYDRAQYSYSHKSLGCYVAQKYKLALPFFDICDSSISNFIALNIISSYLKNKKKEKVLMISIDAPLSRRAAVCALLIENYPTQKRSIFLNLCKIYDQESSSLNDFCNTLFNKEGVEKIYVNFNMVVDQNWIRYDNIFQVLENFSNTHLNEKILILNYNQDIGQLAMLALNKA